MPDEFKAEGHLTPADIIKISNKSGAKKIILTHLYPVCDERNIWDSVKKKVDSEVIVAEDLQEIKI